jgi:hypothetical protein
MQKRAIDTIFVIQCAPDQLHTSKMKNRLIK